MQLRDLSNTNCKGFLTQYGLIIPTTILKARMGVQYNAFLKKLIVTFYPDVGPPKKVQLYSFVTLNNEQNDSVACVSLPRTLKIALEKIIPIEVSYASPRYIEKPLALQINLFENQKILVKHLLELVYTPERIKAGTASAILNLRPGMGKTFVAAGLINELRIAGAAGVAGAAPGKPFRTLYVVPKRPLAVQGVRDLRACFYSEEGGNAPGGIVIGQFLSKEKKKDKSTNHANQDITVIVIDSALRQSREFFAGYSLVIFDEVHTYCTDIRKEVFRRGASWACLGMSGTTEDRKDGFDVISHKELAFDGIIRAEKIPGFTYEDVVFRTDVTVVRYKGPPEFTKDLIHESTGKMFTPYMNKQFISDPHRMKVALHYLRELYLWRGFAPPGTPDSEIPKHNIYVFCEELEPLKKIHAMLRETIAELERGKAAPAVGVPVAGGPNEDIAGPVVAPELLDVAHFVGGTKNTIIENMINNARVFLTTYGYAGTGISMNKMTAIIFLTPRRAGMLQILPRILRRSGDKNIVRRVIDIVDSKTRIKYQYGDRSLAYDYYGMNVEIVEHCYNGAADGAGKKGGRAKKTGKGDDE